MLVFGAAGGKRERIFNSRGHGWTLGDGIDCNSAVTFWRTTSGKDALSTWLWCASLSRPLSRAQSVPRKCRRAGCFSDRSCVRCPSARTKWRSSSTLAPSGAITHRASIDPLAPAAAVVVTTQRRPTRWRTLNPCKNNCDSSIAVSPPSPAASKY